MFKVGDKVQRAKAHTTEWWNEIINTISDIPLCPDGVFTISKIEHGNDTIRFRETGTYSFEAHKFDLVPYTKNQIEVGDVFKTREGRNVRIICTDCKCGQLSVIGLIDCDDTETAVAYNENGIDQWNSGDYLVLPWNEPETDWSKVAVDTLIEVEVGSSKVLRYFSHTESDIVYLFNNGATSKTHCGVTGATKPCCKIHKEEK